MNPQDLIERQYARDLIRRIAHRMDRDGRAEELTLDDWTQELTLALVREASRFDPAWGSVEAFITRVVSLATAMLARRLRAKKRQYDRDWSTRIDEVPAVDRTEHTDLTLDLADAVEDLPLGLRDLAKALMSERLTAYGRRSGTPRSTLQRWASKIRDRFEDRSLSDYL